MSTLMLLVLARFSAPALAHDAPQTPAGIELSAGAAWAGASIWEKRPTRPNARRALTQVARAADALAAELRAQSRPTTCRR